MYFIEQLFNLFEKCLLGLIIFLISFRVTQFLLTWALVIVEDFCHKFVPYEKHYNLWIFKKLDNIINKFRWND